MKLDNATLGILLTRKISLSIWDKIGILDREIKIYIELAKHFKQIYIFTYGVNESANYQNLFPANVKIISKPRFIPSTIYSLILPFVQSNIVKKIDVIRTNQMDGSWAAVFVKKFFNKKLIVRCGYEWLTYLEATYGSAMKRSFAKSVSKFAYGNADGIIITSSAAKDFIVKRFGINEGKINVISNYIDTDKFKPSENSNEKSRVIFVGRLEPVKNLTNLVKAMAGLNTKLTIVGKGSQRNELENVAKANNVEVEFKGTVPQADLPNELNSNSIFVLPSISEGNPKSLLEAMACGLACVGANVGGIREIIADGEDGLLAETSGESLNSKLKMLLENKDLRDRLGSNARAKIVKDYGLPLAISSEINIYQNL